jgi:putative tricarboxylic transport membrane protein
MKKYDLISGFFFLLFAFLICFLSARLPLGSWRHPGAGLFPLLIGIILGLLSAIASFRAYQSKSHESKKPLVSEGKGKNLVVVLSALFVYAICLESLGFLISSFLVLIILFRGVEPQRWTVSVLGSALISFMSYVIFELWLKARLPRGLLGF